MASSYRDQGQKPFKELGGFTTPRAAHPLQQTYREQRRRQAVERVMSGSVSLRTWACGALCRMKGCMMGWTVGMIGGGGGSWGQATAAHPDNSKFQQHPPKP